MTLTYVTYVECVHSTITLHTYTPVTYAGINSFDSAVYNRLTFLHTLPRTSSYFDSRITRFFYFLALATINAVIHDIMPGSPPLLLNGDLHAGGLVMAMAAGLVEGHVCEGVRGVMPLDHCQLCCLGQFLWSFHWVSYSSRCNSYHMFNLDALTRVRRWAIHPGTIWF